MANRTQFGLQGKGRDSYLELIMRFPLTSLRSTEQLEEAQKITDLLLSKSQPDAGETMYLDALSDLISVYEDTHCPIQPPTDAAMLRHLLEAKGITPAQLSLEAGIAKSTVSEILAGKKPFSRQIMRKLADYFEVKVSLLAGN